MIRKTAKIVSVLLGVALTIGLLTGCGNSNTSDTGNTNSSPTQTNDVSAVPNFSYPMNTDITLKYWVELNSNITTQVTNYGDTPFAKEMEKRTGVKIQYLHPTAGQAKEQISLLFASGDLPDIIECDWGTYNGGPVAAMDDKQILSLNEAIDKYSPNLKKWLNELPDINKMVKTDDGRYYCYPCMLGDKSLLGTAGPIVRKDWLDDLGLQPPTTIDEWTTMLRAFKEKKGATAPLCIQSSGGRMGSYFSIFSGAFMSPIQTWFVEDGEVKYGPMQPGYKDFILTMKQWYSEGLLDKNFATTDAKMLDSYIMEGKSGATGGGAGGAIGKYLPAMKDKDPKFDLIGVQYPTLEKGEVRKYGSFGLAFNRTYNAAITTACKNVEVAARYLDYLYSPDGYMFANFGIEGESYEIVNGYPTYTDTVMKNPEGLSMVTVLGLYAKASRAGSYVQDKRYLEQYYSLPQQKEAQKAWAKQETDKYQLPPLSNTSEETVEMSKIMTDVQTLDNEMVMKFIVGVEPMENYDRFIEQMKKLGIEKAATLQQAAYDRFQKR